jgi:glycosyltransferase involved in cell wall biosynthesis
MLQPLPRVAIFLIYLGGGGAERVVLNLALGLVKQGLAVDLVLSKAWGPHLWKVPNEVKIVDLKASNLLATQFALVRYLRQEQPTALLSAMHYANEIAILAKRFSGVSTRVVVSEHNTFSLAIKHTTKARRWLIPFFVRHFYPWADGIVAVSHGAARDLSQVTGLPLEKIRAIYNPVLTPEITEKSKETNNHPWLRSGEPPVVMGVGKLEAQKDYPTLIRAFARVKKVKPCRLMILGWGPDRTRLEALVHELGLDDDVIFLGYVENPYAYMAHTAVFVLSSAWEGLPTVLIEAMSLGVPVVSTDCPSGPAEILDNNKYGYLIPVGNDEELAKGILKVLSEEVKLVEQAWLEQFTIEASTKQYLDVLGISSS